MAEDAATLAEGRRLVNRPGDKAKQEFIASFVEQNRIEAFPAVASDVVADNCSTWASDVEPSKVGIEAVVAQEIEASFRLVGDDPPTISHWIARTILRSDAGAERGTLDAVPLHELSVPLVLGHIASLGYSWPRRVMVSAARRVTMVLMSRRRFAATPWVYDEGADEWEQAR